MPVVRLLLEFATLTPSKQQRFTEQMNGFLFASSTSRRRMVCEWENSLRFALRSAKGGGSNERKLALGARRRIRKVASLGGSTRQVEEQK